MKKKSKITDLALPLSGGPKVPGKAVPPDPPRGGEGAKQYTGQVTFQELVGSPGPARWLAPRLKYLSKAASSSQSASAWARSARWRGALETSTRHRRSRLRRVHSR